VPINFVPAKSGDSFHLGTITIRIMEDGSRTDMRLGSAEFTLPPDTKGPPAHWHEMVCPFNLFSKSCPLTFIQHDETFLVTQGTVRFHAKNGKHIDAKMGDYVTVPTRSPHTFSNPFDEEAKFFNTFTPAHYINYFKLLHTMSQEGVPMNPEANKKAMAYFATIGVDGPL